MAIYYDRQMEIQKEWIEILQNNFELINKKDKTLVDWWESTLSKNRERLASLELAQTFRYLRIRNN